MATKKLLLTLQSKCRRPEQLRQTTLINANRKKFLSVFRLHPFLEPGNSRHLKQQTSIEKNTTAFGIGLKASCSLWKKRHSDCGVIS